MSAVELPEQWRPVNGFPAYEVSDLGRVRSFIRRGRWPVNESGYRILAQSRDRRGYLTVSLHHAGKGTRRRVHHLVLETFVGPCPPGCETRHVQSNNPSDNRLCNLAWGTPQENADDRDRHDTKAAGETCGHSKLTADQVRAIRKLRGVESSSRVAQRFGISPRSVWRVWRSETWRSVQGGVPGQRRLKARRDLSPGEVSEIMSLRGVRPCAEVARNFNLTYQAVYQRWRSADGRCTAAAGPLC